MVTINATTITMYIFAAAAVVSALIAQFVKPWIERIPACSPKAPDQTLHDFALRLANLALNVIAVLVMAAATGQLTLANFWPTVGLVLATALGSHSFYHWVKPKSKAAPAQASTSNDISTPVTPLHQQAAPAPVADAT